MVYPKFYANHLKLWQLSSCSVIAFHKYIQMFLLAENSMTGRAYMREVLAQVWLQNE